jgi:hypothetical protein
VFQIFYVDFVAIGHQKVLAESLVGSTLWQVRKICDMIFSWKASYGFNFISFLRVKTVLKILENIQERAIQKLLFPFLFYFKLCNPTPTSDHKTILNF